MSKWTCEDILVGREREEAGRGEVGRERILRLTFMLTTSIMGVIVALGWS